MKLRFFKGGEKIKEILEFKVTFILRRLRETGPRFNINGTRNPKLKEAWSTSIRKCKSEMTFSRITYKSYI